MEESSILLQNISAMKTLQQAEYISIQQERQQLKLEICRVGECKVEKDEFYRQVSTQLEELDCFHVLSK